MGCYGWMLLAAVATSLGGALFAAGRLGLSRRRAAVCYLLTAAAVLMGSRGLHWIAQPAVSADQVASSPLTPHPVGFALYGGLLAGVMVGGLAARTARLDAWSLADAAAVPTGVGIALVRVGCFAQGCCFGKPSDVPWAVTPSPGSPAFFRQLADNPARLLTGLEPIHPTQIYELAAALAAAVTAAVLLRRRTPRGTAALAAAAVFTALRWAILPFRDLRPTAEADSLVYPTLYAALLCLLAAGIWWRIVSEKKVGPRTSHQVEP